MRSSRKLKSFANRRSVKRFSTMYKRRGLPSLAKVAANTRSEPIQKYVNIGKKLRHFDEFLLEHDSPSAVGVHADLDALVYQHNENLIAGIEALKAKIRAEKNGPAANMDDVLDLFSSLKI